MKKLSTLVIATVMVAFTACNNNNETQENAATSAPETEATAPVENENMDASTSGTEDNSATTMGTDTAATSGAETN